jgi:transcriptional regulator with XRE-family HTH domain
MGNPPFSTIFKMRRICLSAKHNSPISYGMQHSCFILEQICIDWRLGKDYSQAMDLKKLAEALSQRIEQIGISRAELARRAKLSRSTLWIYERGESPETGEPTRPAKDKLERLAAVLTFNPDERQEFLAQLLELAGYESSPNPNTPQAAISWSTPTRRHRSGVLAAPLIGESSDELEHVEATTIGQDIDEVIKGLSQEDRERLRQVLVPHARQLAQLITLAKGDGNEAK